MFKTKMIKNLLGATALSLVTNFLPSVANAQASTTSDWNNEIMYFVIPDRYADAKENNFIHDSEKPGHFHGGDWAGLTGQLDQLQELGITALWITPIVKQIPGFVGDVGFEDYGYHGYWADNFYALEGRLGNEEDLKELVEEAHKRNIKVLVDVVFNHPGYGASYETAKRHWLRIGDECGNDEVTGCLLGLPDFKTEIPEVREYLIESHIQWAEKFGFDGYRIDTIKHVDTETQLYNRSQTKERLDEDFFLMGEHFGGEASNLTDYYFQHGILNSGIDFSFPEATKLWLNWQIPTGEFSQVRLAGRHIDTKGGVLAHYLSSHDQTGMIKELGYDRNKFKVAAGLQLTSLGMPIIYYGEEVARNIGEWPENRSNMPWGRQNIQPGAGEERDEGMRDYYKQLITIRKANPALSTGSYQELYATNEHLTFARRKGNNKVIVSANRSGNDYTISFKLPDDMGCLVEFQNQLTGQTIPINDGWIEITIPAYSMVILTP